MTFGTTGAGITGTEDATGRSGRAKSQKRIAREAGVDPRTVRRAERGGQVSPATAARIRRATGHAEDAASPVHPDAARHAAALRELASRNTAYASARSLWLGMSAIGLTAFLLATGLLLLAGGPTGAASVLLAAGAVLLPVDAIYLVRHRSRSKALLVACTPHAATVIEGIAAGTIRFLSANEVARIVGCCGRDALAEAVDSPLADLRVD